MQPGVPSALPSGLELPTNYYVHRCLLRNESRLEIVSQDPVERAGKPNPYANPEERGAVVESFAGLEYVAFVCFGTKAGLRSFLRIL